MNSRRMLWFWQAAFCVAMIPGVASGQKTGATGIVNVAPIDLCADHYYQGKFDEALRDCNEAVAKDPSSALALRNRATVEAALGHLEEALRDYDAALKQKEISGQEADIYFGRGVVRYRMGRLDEALEDYNKAIALHVDNPTTYVDRGLVYFDAPRHQYDLAIKDYNKAIRMKKEYVDAYVNRAAARRAAGDLEGAEADYSKALSLQPEPGDEATYFNRGTARYEKGDVDGAISDYTKAITLNAHDERVFYNQGVAYQKQGGHLEDAIRDYQVATGLDPKDAQAFYSLGEAHYELGELQHKNGERDHEKVSYQDAANDYTEALKLKAQWPEALDGRGAAYQKLGELDNAIRDYSDALAMSDTLGVERKRAILYHRGSASVDKFVRDHRPNDLLANAIKDCSDAIDLKLDTAEVYDTRGLALQYGKAPGKAISDYSVAIEKRPEYGRAWLHRGEAHNDQNEPDLALADLEKAKALLGDDPAVLAAIGRANYGKKDYGSAIAAYEQEIKLRPTADAYVNSGTAFYRRGIHNGSAEDYKLAVDAYKKAIELRPNDSLAYCDLSAAEVKLGDWAQAYKDAEQAAKLAPPDASMSCKVEALGEAPEVTRLTTEGRGQYEQHQYQAAFDAYDKAVQLSPNDPIALAGRGVARYGLMMTHEAKAGELDAVIADFDAAIEHRSGPPVLTQVAEAYNGRGLAYRDKHDLDQAEKSFKDATDANPKYADAWLNRAEVRSYKAEILQKQGQGEAARAEWTSAVEDYNRGLEQKPGNAIALEGLGLAYYKLGEWAKSIATYNVALSKNPEKPYDLEGWLGLADARCENGDWGGAIEAYNQADKLKPNDAGILLNRGYAHYKMNDGEAAERDYSEAISLNKKSAPAYYDRGFVRYEADRLMPAFRDYDRGLALKKRGAEADEVRGVEAGDRANYRGALKDFNEAIASKQRKHEDVDADLYFNRAEAYRLLKRYAEARSDYDSAIGKQPNDGETYCSSGELWMAQKDPARAEADYKKAIEHTPQDAGILFKRAEARRERHDFSCAARYYDEAIRMKPDWAEAYYGRGIAEGAMERFDDAMKDYNMALEKKPDLKGALLNRADLWLAMRDRESDPEKKKADYANYKKDREQALGVSADAKRVRRNR